MILCAKFGVLIMPDRKERAAFTLSSQVKFELEEAVPKSKRSQFVERAIADALMAQAKKQALEAIENAPAYQVLDKDSVELLRQIRQGRDLDLIDRNSGRTSKTGSAA
jgi:hypothetical protein